MPPKAVRLRIEDFIYYYYAKLVIAPSAGLAGNYRFIVDRYKKLVSGQISMSDYDREIQHLARQPGVCGFCSARGARQVVDLIPARIGGPIGVQNKLYACPECVSSKGNRGFLEWWCDHLGRDKDELPRIPAGLFLKMAHERHTLAFTLSAKCRSIRDLWPEDRAP